MKQKLSFFSLFFLVGFSISIPASAEMVTIDPNLFAPETILNDAVDGVTLSVVGASGDVLSKLDNHAITGEQTFGNSASNGIIPNVLWFEGEGNDSLPGPVLRADFDVLTDSVFIDISNQDSHDNGVLRAFDINDIEIESDFATIIGEPKTLSVFSSQADIAYVTIAGSSNQDSVHLGNLQFNKLERADISDNTPNFDTSTDIVSFPKVTIDGGTAFLDVKLLLNKDGTYAILSAVPE
ncbi:MAG: hypothetical protein GQ582_11800 [Methyloprofundus sp.]|nr:hypothetical protein [Methyloprofundus sp.]